MSETQQNSVVNLVNGQGQLLAELLAGNTYQLTPIKGEAYQLMTAAAGSGTEVSLAQLQLLDIGNITSSNLSSVQAAIAATADDGTGVDSLAELRVIAETPAATITLRDPNDRATPLTLIKPVVSEEGKLYYYVDYSGDGTTSGTDVLNHNVLDGWFNSNTNTVDTQQSGAIAGVDDARTMIIDGYTLVLPTREELLTLYNEAVDVVEMGWLDSYYMTSTLGSSNNHHYYVYPDNQRGNNSQLDDNTNAQLVLQILQNDIVEGTAATDVLTGSQYSEVINGLAGNDTIHGNGGSDMIDAGAGDDAIYLNADNIDHIEDVIIDGGADIDTLHLVGESLSLDFRSIDNVHVQNIEKIDMTGSGDNVLKIDAAEVLDMSSTTDVLKIIADLGDKVHAVDMHDTGMTRVEGEVTYKVYVEPGVNIELWVDEKATVVFSG